MRLRDGGRRSLSARRLIAIHFRVCRAVQEATQYDGAVLRRGDAASASAIFPAAMHAPYAARSRRACDHQAPMPPCIF